MRLINTKTFECKEFFETGKPPYVILSHRWENEEVTYQDLQGNRGSRMKGWAKIEGCCARAAKHGFEYAVSGITWIDSCCIDKSSSAELSEAVNSMYRWYGEAQVCYAFLSDVPGIEASLQYAWDFQFEKSSFCNSKWFSRGWTLQELLAPVNLVFFDNTWTEIGTKSSLSHLLTTITGVSDEHLFEPRGASVAQKMSWAAKRVTTRIEDQAYCLMGLFAVNMPLLYGEGERAFMRLQHEILRTSEDATIFAWDDVKTNNFPFFACRGLLAKSPLWFQNSGGVVTWSVDGHQPTKFVCSMTNRGLQINTPYVSYQDLEMVSEPMIRVFGVPSIIIRLPFYLNGKQAAMMLQKHPESKDEYHRYHSQTLDSMKYLYTRTEVMFQSDAKYQTIYIPSPSELPARNIPIGKAIIQIQSLETHGFRFLRSHGPLDSIVDLGNPGRFVQAHTDASTGDSIWSFNNDFFRTNFSLLLIFTKGESRLSLQLCVCGRRFGLSIVLAEQHETDERESTCREDAGPWQNQRDRVHVALPDGHIVFASVDIVLRDQLVYLVTVKVSGDVPSTAQDQQESDRVIREV